MPLALALAVVFGLLGFLFVALAREQPPGPADVAESYERAWDRLDFAVIFDLSGDELRDGMKRADFVAAKRAAHAEQPSGAIAARIEVERVVREERSALVVTRVTTTDGAVRNDLTLARRSGAWLVTGYGLHSDDPASSPR